MTTTGVHSPIASEIRLPGDGALARALIRLDRESAGGPDELSPHTSHTDTHSSNPW
jgi:hypothetical protein